MWLLVQIQQRPKQRQQYKHFMIQLASIKKPATQVKDSSFKNCLIKKKLTPSVTRIFLAF